MQHSASSISLADRCDRAWWHRYRDKLKPPEIPWLKAKRMKARGERLPAGAYSKALGTEMHRLAELYLTLPPRKAARLIDWNDLPGQCLAELVPHLPPAGSVPRSRVEHAFSVTVNGVSFRGLIDVLGAALAHVVEVYDHKTTRDIREYALLPDAVAQRLRQPKRSLKNDLQACLYVLARAKRTSANARTDQAKGGTCRWNYTETQRTRRSLPVVQFIPTAHAETVVARAAVTAKRVEAFKTIDDAVPDTTACDDYGGCWYRSEGHCNVPRKIGFVIVKLEREEREKQDMGKLNFKALGAATAKANEAEETKAKAASAAPAKRKTTPPPPVEDTDEDDAEETDEDEEEETPAPRVSKRVAKKVSKRAPAKAAEPEETDEDDTGEDDAEEIERVAKTPTPSARESFNAATSAPDHILQFFKPAPGLKGEAKINAMAFSELADHLAASLARNPERAQCLRFLLQAADCAARAATGDA